MARPLRTYRVMLACEPRRSYGKAEGPEEAAAIARAVLRRDCDPDQECFLVLACDARGQVTGYKVVGVGTLTACLVHPREVFRAAIELGAVAIICVHNHPSGDPGPSSEDSTLHDRLTAAGEILGIPILDSLIVTTTGATWSQKEGLLGEG